MFAGFVLEISSSAIVDFSQLRSLLVEKEKQEMEWDQLKTELGRKLKSKDDVIVELEEKLQTFSESTAEEQKQKSEEIRLVP